MSNQAYTLGRTKVYDLLLTQYKPAGRPWGVCKIGEFIMPNNDFYPGGWVWKEPHEAMMACRNIGLLVDGWDPKDFSVYMIELPNGWEQDAKPPKQDGIHNLRNDAKIIRKVFDNGTSTLYLEPMKFLMYSFNVPDPKETNE